MIGAALEPLLRRYAFPLYLRIRPPRTELSPDRLYAYLDALWECRAIQGDVVEIGCFRGGTTRVAYGFLQRAQPSRRYLAVDTFAGFVDRQFDHDHSHGTPSRLRTGFSLNGYQAVRRSLDADGCAGVELVEGDITTLPDSALPEQVAVCLLDVDLDIPTYEGLRRIVARLAPGGKVLVDDCDPANDYAGALEGYRRFVAERRHPEEYFMNMGVVRADAATA